MVTQNTVSKKTYTGAQIIVQTLKNLGVDTIFGYPGGVVLSIYDELFKQNDIKHYLVRHEQAAVHAAEGYARVTGKCGVASGKALWVVWQPVYGYYWTLFRVYDKNGNLIDEICYGFENI